MAKRGLFDWQYVLLWCGVAAAAAIFWLDPIRRLAISGQQLVGFMIIGLYVYARFIHDDLKKKTNTSHYYQILINEGDGHFVDRTKELLPQSTTPSYWTIHIYLVDLKHNGVLDLVTQPVRLIPLTQGRL